jgi:D-sedoheptulose 7-phosphate isomerase
MNDLLLRYPTLAVCRREIAAAEDTLLACFRAGGKLLLCGNGGSAADCDHIAGELGKAFLKKRPIPEERRAAMAERCPEVAPLLDRLEDALPAIPLTSLTALLTAYGNDREAELGFAQATLSLGKAGDILLAISTSGNSKNVLATAKVARSLGMRVIALTGEGGGALGAFADITLAVPERETFKVQELHLPLYHYLCAAVERRLFG